MRDQGEASRLGLLLLFLFAICLTGFGSRQGYVLSFAGTTSPARLALVLHLPARAPETTSLEPALFPDSIFLTLEIGQRGSADFIELSGIPLDFSGTDEEQVITVGNIRPGMRKRVYLEARDESGNVLTSARYSVNLHPGHLTSHVARLRIRSETPADGEVALQEPAISIETRGVESLFFEAALDDITLGGTLPFGPDKLILEDPDAREAAEVKESGDFDPEDSAL